MPRKFTRIPIGICSLTSLNALYLEFNKIKPSGQNRPYYTSEMGPLRERLCLERKQLESKDLENKIISKIQNILNIVSQVRVDIPMTLPRLSELVNLDKKNTETILISILDQQPDLGEYLTLEQVFIKKSEVKEEIFTKSTFTDSLQICKHCDDSQSILIRTCTNCEEALPYCNICKRGFAEKDQITNCPECDNPFHRTHLIAQVQSSGSCPVCRNPLTLAQVS